MTRKEKRQLLDDLENSKMMLKDLQSNIEEKKQNISKLEKEEVKLKSQVGQYKKYFDLKEAIKELEDKKQELENDINFSFDVSELAFAEYSVTHEDVENNIRNLGIFRIFQSDGYDRYGNRAIIYENVFNSELLCGINNEGKCSYVTVNGKTVTIKRLKNIISLGDVLIYMNDVDLLSKSKLNRKDLTVALQFLTENASSFGLYGYDNKVKLLHKSK